MRAAPVGCARTLAKPLVGIRPDEAGRARAPTLCSRLSHLESTGQKNAWMRTRYLLAALSARTGNGGSYLRPLGWAGWAGPAGLGRLGWAGPAGLGLELRARLAPLYTKR